MLTSPPFFSQQTPQDLWSWFFMSIDSLQRNVPEIPHSWGTASQLSFFLPVYFLRNLTKKMYIIQDPHARCSDMNCCGMRNQSLAISFPVSRLTCANSGKIILANREQCERAHQIISTCQLFMFIAMAMIIISINLLRGTSWQVSHKSYLVLKYIAILLDDWKVQYPASLLPKKSGYSYTMYNTKFEWFCSWQNLSLG